MSRPALHRLFGVSWQAGIFSGFPVALSSTAIVLKLLADQGAGYGAAARELVPALAEGGIPYLITTLSPEGANEAARRGYPVLRGGASKQRTLQLAVIGRVRTLVIADDDIATPQRIAAVACPLNEEVEIVARTRYRSDVGRLHGAGVLAVISEETEGVLQLARVLLERSGAPAAAEGNRAEPRPQRSGASGVLQHRHRQPRAFRAAPGRLGLLASGHHPPRLPQCTRQRRVPARGGPLGAPAHLTPPGEAVAAGCISVTVALDNSAAEEASFRKWPLPVLYAVGEQPARYSEIRDRLPGITDRALAGALKQLQSGVLVNSLSRG